MGEPWGAALSGDPCRECGWAWPDPPDCLEFVAGVPQEFARVLTGVDGATRFPAHGWSVTGYVAHVGDNLRQMAERVAGALAGGTSCVSGYDPDELARARGYEYLDLAAALWSLQHSSSQWVEVVRVGLDSQLVLQHTARGEQSAQDIARNNAHDAFHHLRDVRCAVEFARWPYPETLAAGPVRLRLSTPDDVDVITGWLADPLVHRGWGGSPLTREAVQRKYSGVRAPDVTVYVVERDGRPAGVLQAWHDPDGSCGLDLFLAAAEQGRGTGARAARALAADLTRRGWRGLSVDPGNSRQVQFWGRAGFVATGEKGVDDGHETTVMRFEEEPGA